MEDPGRCFSIIAGPRSASGRARVTGIPGLAFATLARFQPSVSRRATVTMIGVVPMTWSQDGWSRRATVTGLRHVTALTLGPFRDSPWRRARVTGLRRLKVATLARFHASVSRPRSRRAAVTGIRRATVATLGPVWDGPWRRARVTGIRRLEVATLAPFAHAAKTRESGTRAPPAGVPWWAPGRPEPSGSLSASHSRSAPRGPQFAKNRVVELDLRARGGGPGVRESQGSGS